MLRKQTYLLLILSLFISCGSGQNQSIDLQFTVGLNPNLRISIGHEDLTFEAIKDANRFLGSKFFPASGHTISTTTGFESRNTIIRGNYLVDSPMDRRQGEIELSRYASISIFSNSSWHTAKESQAFHFLRITKPLDSAKTSCRKSLTKITELADIALTLYTSHRNLAENALGAASHIIQDSYSTAHTVRMGSKILDVCNFGEKSPDTCHHSLLAIANADLIYTPKILLPPGSPNNSRMLKPEAHQALNATTQFFMAMARSIDDGSARSNLESYYKTYIDCTAAEDRPN